MNNNTDTTKTGLGFLSILTLIFVVAKIMGYLSWSWWVVFLPMLIPVALIIVAIVVSWIVMLWLWLDR